MLKIFDREHIRNIEENARTGSKIISTSTLYETMGNAFCNQFNRMFNDQRKVIVFAGPSQNGAIALAIARILFSMNRSVDAFLLNPGLSLSEEVTINKTKLQQCGCYFMEFNSSFRPPRLSENDIVIDGLFGSELEVPIEGDMEHVVHYLNSKAHTIVSVDMPSGLFAQDNSHNNPDNIIRAHHTFTFHGAKLSLLLSDNEKYVGKWRVINCGLEEDHPQKNIKNFIFTTSDLDNNLDSRGTFCDKRDFGHVALIAGSQGMMGAAILGAKACMRTGSGLITVHVPQGKDNLIHTTIPEAIVETDKSPTHFTEVRNVNKYSAIAIGPGLGTQFESAAAMESLLNQYKKPIIIDADAINILASNPTLLNLLTPDSILTPHKRELDRLVGESGSDYERLRKASAFAQRHRVYVVVKGAYTATCLPQGVIIFNQTGNPGMATAGSGDVLTGMMLSFLGQGFDSLTSAVFAVFIHGYAGDRYAESNCQESLLASDIIDYIPVVFKHFKKLQNYY
ncbi:hypothetical protein HQ29_07555 [Porphyromonas canoris]|uniref:NAD(P)H-hydrate dehydratase n=1 Tax=Porphyromonas canoris TaxID=36875 RepID=UPI00051D5F90|nr:NAD(P)H-hydrate dehydratase [Porphyromonas canoris]KGL51816.1 hypothetical protein HQ29_07555 [Porphyromonas canoris]